MNQHKIVLIDNYDSFSYNLYQLIGSMHPHIYVVRNDQITVDEIRGLEPKAIVLSPGPGYPSKAGVCIEVVKQMSGEYPILGVCLGHQAICEAYGATVSYAKRLMHGKTSMIRVDKTHSLFTGLEEEVAVARYHSLSVKEDTLPDCLQVIGRAEDGEIMAVAHKQDPVYGVQFHPESVLTPQGHIIIQNFLGGQYDSRSN